MSKSFDFDTLVNSVKKEPEPEQPINGGARVRIKRSIKRVVGSFKQGIADQITSILLNNMDYFARVILSNDPYGCANRRDNVLQLTMGVPKSRKYLVAAKKMREYVNWDTQLFTDGVLEFIYEHGIRYNSAQKEWLYWEVENFRLWLFDLKGARL